MAVGVKKIGQISSGRRGLGVSKIGVLGIPIYEKGQVTTRFTEGTAFRG